MIAKEANALHESKALKIIEERLKRLELIANNVLLNEQGNEKIKTAIITLNKRLTDYQKAANEKDLIKKG